MTVWAPGGRQAPVMTKNRQSRKLNPLWGGNGYVEAGGDRFLQTKSASTLVFSTPFAIGAGYHPRLAAGGPRHGLLLVEVCVTRWPRMLSQVVFTRMVWVR